MYSGKSRKLGEKKIALKMKRPEASIENLLEKMELIEILFEEESNSPKTNSN
jgi:hypothetical protein